MDTRILVVTIRSHIKNKLVKLEDASLLYETGINVPGKGGSAPTMYCIELPAIYKEMARKLLGIKDGQGPDT